MPIHDRIGRAISKGFGVLTDVAGDVFGQAVQQLPGFLLGGLSGGAPTSVPTGINPAPGAQASLARLFGRFDVPIQRTFPGVPGDPLGGALRIPREQGGPMAFPRTALPGGAPIQLAGLGAFGAGVASNLLGEGLFQGLFNGGNGQAMPAGVCPPLFVPAQAALRAVRMFRVTNPSTGTDVWYRNAGRPLLWSGDFAAVKRVRRVAGKARRKR